MDIDIYNLSSFPHYIYIYIYISFAGVAALLCGVVFYLIVSQNLPYIYEYICYRIYAYTYRYVCT